MQELVLPVRRPQLQAAVLAVNPRAPRLRDAGGFPGMAVAHDGGAAAALPRGLHVAAQRAVQA